MAFFIVPWAIVGVVVWMVVLGETFFGWRSGGLRWTLNSGWLEFLRLTAQLSRTLSFDIRILSY